MFILIFSLIFAAVAATSVFIGVLKGKKKVWQLSVTRMIISVVSALISAIASSLVAYFSVNALTDLFVNSELQAIVDEAPTVLPIVSALISMIVAPMIFLLLYSMIRPILSLFTKLLTRLFVKVTASKKEKCTDNNDSSVPYQLQTEGSKYLDELYNSNSAEVKKVKKHGMWEFKLEKNNWISAVCGGLCAFVTLCILCVPLVGTLDVIGDVASLPLHNASALDESGTVELLADALDGASHNACTYSVKAVGGGLLYDMMTTYKVNGENATLRKEAGTVKALANAFIVSSNGDTSKDDKAKSIRDIAVAFEKSTIIPTLISDVGSSAAKYWENGEDYYGISLPSMGDAFDPLMLSMVSCLADTDVVAIKQDVYTLTDIVAVFAENDMLGSIVQNPMALFSNESATSQIMLDLLNNERLYPMVDGFSDFGITLLMNTVDIPKNTEPLYDEFISRLMNAHAESEADYVTVYSEIFDDYGIRVSNEQLSAVAQHKLNGGDITVWVTDNAVADKDDFLKKTELVSIKMITDGVPEITDKKAEAVALARSYRSIYELTDGINESGFDVKNMLKDLGPVLDAFAKTESIGLEKTNYILKGLLQSNMVHDKIGFSVLGASDSAASITKNATVKGYGSMLNSLALVVDVVDAASSLDKDTKSAVDAMLEDLTPESAEVIQAVTTPEVVSKYGVPDRSSEPISNMISDTFGNLSDAKEAGMSDEEYAKESAAVSDMMNVLMSTGKGGTMFGENGRTGGSAAQFVDNIMDSNVMSSTIVDTVYDGGTEPKNDPLSSNRQLGEEEKAEYVAALNDKWNASDKSDVTRKEIFSLAAIMNVQIDITESGVVPVTVEQ